MHVTIVAIGSRGDVEPFVALGMGLQDSGHTVRLATHGNFEKLVRDHGLEFSLVAGDPRKGMGSDGWHQALERDRNLLRFMSKFVGVFASYVNQVVADCWEACKGTNVIMASPLGIFCGYHVAEKLNLPLIRAFYAPVSPTRAYPAALIPAGLCRGERSNLWSHHLSRQMLSLLVTGPLNRARHEVLNLESLPRLDVFGRLDRERSLLLYGYSPLLFSRPADWGEWIHVTGHWFLEHPAAWQPPSDLVDFLESGPPPVYVGFGSMSNSRPGETTEMVVRALQRTRQRGVLLTGWGGLEKSTRSDDIYFVDEIPFAWLFPRMAAVVHHGGAGTTHAALRAGVPSLVIPFMPDQRFWGQRLYAIGGGASPIRRSKLSTELLTEGIRTVIQDQPMQRRTRALGERARAEDGVVRAVEIFNSHLGAGTDRLPAATTGTGKLHPKTPGVGDFLFPSSFSGETRWS